MPRFKWMGSAIQYDLQSYHLSGSWPVEVLCILQCMQQSMYANAAFLNYLPLNYCFQKAQVLSPFSEFFSF